MRPAQRSLSWPEQRAQATRPDLWPAFEAPPAPRPPLDVDDDLTISVADDPLYL